MIVCYIDDSDDHLSSTATMAGYFATSDGWEVYEQESGEIYQRYGIEVFHAKDFKRTKGEFRGWSAVRKNSFAKELFQAAGRTVACGVSVCVKKSLYKSFRAASRSTSQISVHGMALGVLVSKFCSGHMLPRLVDPALPINLIVESSNRDGEFLKVFEKFRSGSRNVESIDFVAKNSSRAIHLADFWAMYSRQICGPLGTAQGVVDLPDPIKSAFDCLSHALDVVHGTAKLSANKREIEAGLSTTTWFGPARLTEVSNGER